MEHAEIDIHTSKKPKNGGGNGGMVQITQSELIQTDGKKNISLFTLFNKQQIKNQKPLLDNDIVILFCSAGLSLHLADSLEWKWLLKHAVPNYDPPSVTTLADTHIPSEAAHISVIVNEKLKKLNNLSISFDGNTTHKPQSIYTIHIATPNCQVYLIKGHEASKETHTGMHLFQVIEEVCLRHLLLFVTVLNY
jgi:hypothetical protein